jgi:uncharacterized protein YkwD
MGLSRRALLGFLACARARGAEDVRAVEREVFDAVNRERRSRRLPVLDWSEDVAEEARRHSRTMDARNFFGHRDPDRGSLGQRLRDSGIRYRACAENLYQQSGMPNPGAEAVRAWLRSRGHRSNLLNRAYTDTGVGVTISSGSRYTVTQIFLA